MKVNTGYIPSLYHVATQDEMGQLCLLKKYDLDNNEFSFVFLNQVCGDLLQGFNIDPQTINKIDGYIQCSPHGPDKWPFHVTCHTKLTLTCMNLDVYDSKSKPFLMKNRTRKRKSTLHKSIQGKWTKHKNLIPHPRRKLLYLS